MKIIKYLLPMAFVFAAFSCSIGEKTLYSWDKYETATHTYAKDPSEKNLEDLFKCYDKIISKQNGVRKVVPPGIYAEKAYLMLGQGKKDEAISYLKQEIALYPESKLFIDKIIKQISK